MKRKILFLFISLFTVLGLNAQNIIYVYGDVAADGTLPSGVQKPFHQMRLNDEGNLGMSGFKEAIEEVGCTINEVYDQEIVIDSKFLKSVDVLILGSNQRVFTEAEAKALKRWVKNGGGVIAWSDSGFGGEYSLVGLDNDLGRVSDNSLMAQFGMYFLTDNGAGNYLVSEYTQNHYINKNNKHKGVSFRGEGVSFVRVSQPAIMLAKAQEGGLGGRLVVNAIDGEFHEETDASLAIAEISEGRVLGVFDRNLFWNAGAGTRLSHSDNKEFAQRIVLWAAGIEEEQRFSDGTNAIVAAINTPPTVTIDYVYTEADNSLAIAAVITDSDSDDMIPEIRWEQVKGPANVVFENNNPNTTTPRIFLPEVGKYVFRAIIMDGEFEMIKKLEFERE
ncbi:hypothetical protein BZG02_20080 [Labilibaculum filiforme]|uniref:DUF4350 domain-containing protein n=1 Tax=Labilibaculum filiforme TaxID=1940526 RepID=A0A2N3HQ97_9BACT|nr:hypothetical protein [Labilibaculum filiforme]PKQ60246.1 hypothetical protein BZG02_20080 [Labilibaculum filiforme]